MMYRILNIFLILFPSIVISQSDFDGDGIENSKDNCPYLYNPNQEDLNEDGIGDICTWSDILLDDSVSVMEDSPEGYEILLNNILISSQKNKYNIDISSFDDILEVSSNDLIKLKVDFNTLEDRILKIPITLSSINGDLSQTDSLEIRKIKKVRWERYIDDPQNGYEVYYYYSIFSGAIDRENEFVGPQQYSLMGNQKNFHFEDIDDNGIIDIIGEEQQVWSSRLNENFYVGRNGRPTYLTIQNDWSILVYQEDKEKPDYIFHNADLFDSEDFNGDGKKELIGLGEHYHSAFIDDPNSDKRSLAKNIFKDLGFIENKDFDEAGKKHLRLYDQTNGRYIDVSDKRIDNSTFDGNPFISIFGHAIGDIDNDGDLDIVLTTTRLASESCGKGGLNILINDGDGNFVGSFYCETNYNVHSRSEGPNLLVDINGDGFKDYLFSGANSDGYRHQIGFYLNKGDGTFDIENYKFIESLFSHENLAFKDIYLFDVNNDGVDEIIAYRSIDLGTNIVDTSLDYFNEILILKIENGTLVDITLDVIPNYNKSRMNSANSNLQLEDIDGDGLKDLSVQYFTDPVWYNWLNERGSNRSFTGYWKPDYNGFTYFKNMGGHFELKEVGMFQYSPEMKSRQNEEGFLFNQSFIKEDMHSGNLGGDLYVKDLDQDGVAELIHRGRQGKNLIIFKRIPTDTDRDGIYDNEDQCPNTPEGVLVDTNGCEIFTLPNDVFSVNAINSTCVDSDNGSIRLSSTDTNYNYLYSIDGSDPTPVQGEVSIPGLGVGSYNVCFTVDGVDNYERCYKVSVGEPDPLEVSSLVNFNDRSLDLNLRGSKSYQVLLNGKTLTTDESRISLSLQSGKNTIEVKGEQDCQGIYFEEIFVSEEVKVYPNPTNGPLQLYVSGMDSSVEVSITSINGVLVHTTNRNVPMNRVLDLDLTNLNSGTYIISIKGSTIQVHQKVIKR